MLFLISQTTNESIDGILPGSIPCILTNNNCLNLEGDSMKALSDSLIPRRSDSVQSLQSFCQLENSYDRILSEKMKATNFSKSFIKHVPTFQERMNDYFSGFMRKSFCETNKDFMHYLQYKKSSIKSL